MLKIAKLISTIIMGLILAGCKNQHHEFQGYVEGRYSYISSSFSGNLTQLLVSRGQQVTTNQPLFILDPKPESDKANQAKYQLQQAQENLVNLLKGQRETVIAGYVAQLAQAEANLSYITKTLNRYKKLYSTRVISKADFDQAKSSYQQAAQRAQEIKSNIAEAKQGGRENLISAQQAAVLAASAELKQAEWALLQKSVRAPQNALVFDTTFQVGEFVPAGNPVVTLLPPEEIKIIFFIPEKILSAINMGEKITINCDGCKQPYSAKISFISPTAEFTPPVIFSHDQRDKLVYRIEATPPIEDAPKLHPGQPVDVKL